MIPLQFEADLFALKIMHRAWLAQIVLKFESVPQPPFLYSYHVIKPDRSL